ncbi:DUF483 domain-containing protein [archaeon]|jgi:hypothetical protein|nr:DUF483 domain-containing protein [archaeon]MBT4648048.1 DUF483 domain-containing protein [archaeon]MBT6822698.1 DUF483 domain-containing protein [archaeon]MBT7392441.1 DUF483 domain-containing protein [archaeon]
MLNELIPIFGTRIKSLEILSLLQNKKPVVRQGFYDDELKIVKKFCKKNNLFIEISDIKIKILDKNIKFSNKGIIAKENEIGMRFVYISKDEYLAVKSHYYEIVHDHKNLGKFLGYPKCCSEFFSNNFDSESDLNNIFIEKAAKDSNLYSYYNNILNRHKDYALIFHFPCKFDCKESIKIGKNNLNLLDNKNKKEFINNLKGKFNLKKEILEFK